VEVRLFACILAVASAAASDPTSTVVLRGKSQTLHLYGSPSGPPIIVTSGDGGWVHLGPDVARYLASEGYSVFGFDAKAYLTSFTEGEKTLAPGDVPGDYKVIVDAARQGRDVKVPLVGVSEGAGLSVLAASDPALQPLLAGVVGLGLPQVNELGWRWRDQVIYITKRAPKEPTFNASDFVPRLGSLRLVAIHSTHDEFVPLEEVKRAVEPLTSARKLWLIDATDHRFSGNTDEMHRRLLEALEWFKAPES
jgi:pimeloyl-ACP methyl ester carboxylesterase